ncbi:MAG: DUF11 domain-containing protein [Anaerolineae bacterium]|nr:DUF11 domain-containing protein [Anaerolineae bacterium]
MQTRVRQLVLSLTILVILRLSATIVVAQVSSLPTFSKTFTPSTIGPGSVSTLIFTITAGTTPVTDLAFTDTLPAGVTIADPANATTSCTDGILTAPDGGDTISLSNGSVGASGSCTVSVDVTSSTVGTHSNTSGDLTSSEGNSGTAAADLIVATNRPGFSKSFSPSTVFYGQRSTLTFTIDNTANSSLASNLTFTDNLPTGMVIADPSNAATTCTGGVVTAEPGQDVISFGSGFVLAGASCTVTVDVVATGLGDLNNSSGTLTALVSVSTLSSGKANDTLAVTHTDIALTKSFVDDPVSPGGTVPLVFSLTNFNRNNSATNIAFTDDLDATLSGLVATGLPQSNVCGAGSQLTGTSTLSLTGGSLAADGGNCTFTVTLQIPAGATEGVYPNTTSSVSATLGGTPGTHNAASENLYIEPVPILTKSFTDDPVTAGGTVTLAFTITNSSTSSAATSIAFIDDLTAFLPFPVSVTVPSSGFCGGGSSITVISLGTERQGLSMTNGSLAASGSCTFSVTIDIPTDMANGTYTNTTEDITATIDGKTRTGQPASDDLIVVAAPDFSKAFSGSAIAGQTVDLIFELSQSEEAPSNATDITFTDDLTGTLSGLTATGLPQSNVCGTGSQISGTTELSFSGGSLTPGETCTISVTLQVPADALPGRYPNTTSNLTATVAGLNPIAPPAEADLVVAGLSVSKTFADDPTIIPGETVDLAFTLINSTTLGAATSMAFTDNLNDALSGMTAIGLPVSDICGSGSSLQANSGNKNLIFSNGSLNTGESCTFTVTVQVPTSASSGDYVNTTSNLSAQIDGNAVVVDPANDILTVNKDVLLFSKQFSEASANAGDTVTLAFTMTNSYSTATATSIAFTDDLDAMLSGMTAVGLPMNNVCGSGSQLSGTSTLSLTGGSLAEGATCSFDVTLQVPDPASLGEATNTTSQPTATINSLDVTGNAASDSLVIEESMGTIFIDKVTDPTGDSTEFTILLEDGPSALNRTLIMSDTTTPVSITVIAGSGYTLSETNIPAVWELTSTTCDDGSPFSNIDVSKNEIVTCTLTNTFRTFDLAISKSAVRSDSELNGVITYTVTVDNNGPSTVTNTIISDPLPSGITNFVSWSCAASGGVTCPSTTGTGAISETTGSFPSGGQLIYTIRATLVSSDTVVTNTASVTTTLGNGQGETQPGNNSAVHVSEPNPIPPTTRYLPLVVKDSGPPLPDLVIEKLVATSSGVTVTIQNKGSAAVSDAFWVDVYYNKATPPAQNQTGDLYWGMSSPNGGVPIAAGQIVTLTLSSPYYAGGTAPTPGTTVYGRVDSIGPFSYGAVLEQNESNNLAGPIVSTSTLGKVVSGTQHPFESGALPARK